MNQPTKYHWKTNVFRLGLHSLYTHVTDHVFLFFRHILTIGSFRLVQVHNLTRGFLVDVQDLKDCVRFWRVFSIENQNVIHEEEVSDLGGCSGNLKAVEVFLLLLLYVVAMRLHRRS